jgi:putative oxidoreductase
MFEEVISRYGLALGRILLVGIFLVDAIYNKLVRASRSKAYMKRFGLPCPTVFLISTVALEFLAVGMVLFRWHAALGAFLLFCFLLGTVVVFHRFWNYSDPLEAQNQLNHFMKNLAIMGGCIFLMFLER